MKCCERLKSGCRQGRDCPNRPAGYSGYTLAAIAAGVLFVIFVFGVARFAPII